MMNQENKVNKENYLKMIEENPHSILKIDEPFRTTELWLHALSKDGFLIPYIPNPTREMYLTAIRQNGYVLLDISCPTDEMKLEAIKQSSEMIRYIRKPTHEMIVESLKNQNKLNTSIEKTPERIKRLAVKHYPATIKDLCSPSEELILEAVRQEGMLILELEKPTESVLLEAIKQTGAIVSTPKFKRFLTEEMILEALFNNPFVFDHLMYPTEEMKELHSLFSQKKELNNSTYRRCRYFLQKKSISTQENPYHLLISLCEKKLKQ